MTDFAQSRKIQPSIQQQKGETMVYRINGVEVKVGQTWRTRDGDTQVIASFDHVDEKYPIVTTTGDWYTSTGVCHEGMKSDEDLASLVSQPFVEPDAEGWFRFQDRTPALGDLVDVKGPCHKVNGTTVDADYFESWANRPDNEWRYSSGDTPRVCYHDDIRASVSKEELAALRATQIEMFDSPFNAISALEQAANHLRDRAATYDKPEGERSMDQTVQVFNLFHGTSITEAQGWHFMQILKDVRLFTRNGFHADSAEDCTAYSALKAEAKAKEAA